MIVLSGSRKEWNLVSSVHIYTQCTISYTRQKKSYSALFTYPYLHTNLAFPLLEVSTKLQKELCPQTSQNGKVKPDCSREAGVEE